ncbi:hypothetical protein CRG98_035778 [Punica granatum]|uniref:Uncharacterized protein n=1 Tax=Punica granatum TaxID=22663 RepID=A0A2I0IIJ0_PUNGR|nr:hypothetical protein CRG98_035778 [Punica granatum]
MARGKRLVRCLRSSLVLCNTSAAEVTGCSRKTIASMLSDSLDCPRLRLHRGYLIIRHLHRQSIRKGFETSSRGIVNSRNALRLWGICGKKYGVVPWEKSLFVPPATHGVPRAVDICFRESGHHYSGVSATTMEVDEIHSLIGGMTVLVCDRELGHALLVELSLPVFAVEGLDLLLGVSLG